MKLTNETNPTLTQTRMMSKASLLFIALFMSLLSCTKSAGDAPGGGGSGENPIPNNNRNTVTGVVQDRNGNPIAGASVRVENDVLNTFSEGITDANGRYSLPVEFGGWKVYAWKETEYDGKLYYLRMAMPSDEDYNPFSADADGAVVKNFVWQLEGEIPDRSRDRFNSFGYFGGSINFKTLDIDFNALPDGTEVTVTCTPVEGATLFDGTPATTVVRTFTAHDESPANYLYLIHDIPQSHYNISATCVIGGEQKTILMGWRIDETTHESIDNFSFSPVGGGHGNYESGIENGTNQAIYMRVAH